MKQITFVIKGKPAYKAFCNAVEEQILDGNKYGITMESVKKANKVTLFAEDYVSIHAALIDAVREHGLRMVYKCY